MSQKPPKPKLTQAEADLVCAFIKHSEKGATNSCFNECSEAIAGELGIKKTAAEKRWSRLAIRVRKAKEAADKEVVAGIAEETEAETSGEGQDVVTKNDGGMDLKTLGFTPKRHHKTPMKDKVSKDKVIKKKAPVTKGKRGKKGIKDEATAKVNIKKEETDEDFDDDEAAF